MPSGYTSRIVKETGASVMTALSGGSFNMNTGTVLSASGRLQLGGGVGITGGPTFSEGGCYAPVGAAASFASSGVKLGVDMAGSGTGLGVWEIMDFGNGVKFFLSKTQNAPSAAGSPGSLLIRLPCTGTPSSAVDLYFKRGDNCPASGNWVAFLTTASAG